MKSNYLGEVFETTKCGSCKVVDYKSYSNVTVVFQDGYVKKTSISKLKTGKVLNPQTPTVFGKGINNTLVHPRIKNLWYHMLRRCYCKDFKVNNPTYVGCYCSEDFLKLSEFKKFILSFENIEYYMSNGWCLDKDLLSKGNKIYSAETCTFLPKELNNLLTTAKASRGDLPIGVSKRKNSHKYIAQINKGREKLYLGDFNTVEDAFLAYKTEKEIYIKQQAMSYKDHLHNSAFSALINFEVSYHD